MSLILDRLANLATPIAKRLAEIDVRVINGPAQDFQLNPSGLGFSSADGTLSWIHRQPDRQRDSNLLSFIRIGSEVAATSPDATVALATQNNELIATNAGQQVPLSQDGTQARGNGAEESVAHSVTVAIDDVLEMVEIQPQQANLTGPKGAATSMAW